jgi:hypothetical protein
MAKTRSLKSKIIRTAGKWDPADRPLYFTASDIGTHIRAGDWDSHPLVAINAIKTTVDRAAIDGFIADGRHVLIDSGVFELSTQHAAKHDMTMADALALAPNKIDGFDSLYDSYVRTVAELGATSWGYIEIDQGGMVNKTKTRERLEDLGLNPMPVYHPFNDPYDYFDFLAERYDRVCIGNLVQADPATRLRLVATIWERRRRYPHLWVHGLGVTPSDLTVAYPLDSCDSSTWMSSIRWGTFDAKCYTRRAWALGKGFAYDMTEVDHPQRGRKKAAQLSGYDARMMTKMMQVIQRDQERILGADTRMTLEPP